MPDDDQPAAGGPPPPQWAAPDPAAGAPSGNAQWGAQWGGQAGSPWAVPPAAPLFAKPGVIPLRPLTLGDILDGALTTVRRYPGATLGISAMVVTLTQLLQFALLVGPFDDIRHAQTDPGSVDVSSLTSSVLTGVAIGLVVTLLGTTVLTGFLTQVVGQAVLGQPISLGETWSRVRPRMLPLLGLSLLTTVATLVGLVLLVIPGVVLYVSWSLATPALVLERAGIRTALGRSWRLVSGSWWRVFGILLVVQLIRSTLGGILTLPFNVASGVYTNVFSHTTHVQTTGELFLTTLGRIVANTIVLPFAAGAVAILYVDRRMRSEGLDLTLARAAVAADQRAGGR